jgi:hypothetical protein
MAISLTTDIYELLRQALADGRIPVVVLLGSHGEDEGESPLVTQVVLRIVEGVPYFKLSSQRLLMIGY